MLAKIGSAERSSEPNTTTTTSPINPALTNGRDPRAIRPVSAPNAGVTEQKPQRSAHGFQELTSRGGKGIAESAGEECAIRVVQRNRGEAETAGGGEQVERAQHVSVPPGERGGADDGRGKPGGGFAVDRTAGRATPAS
jgi:hypothetical protein